MVELVIEPEADAISLGEAVAELQFFMSALISSDFALILMD